MYYLKMPNGMHKIERITTVKGAKNYLKNFQIGTQFESIDGLLYIIDNGYYKSV